MTTRIGQRSKGRESRSKPQLEALERHFKGMVVRDAIQDLRIVSTKEDVANATQGDAENCALAQSCKRMFGSHAVIILKCFAYLDLPTEGGEREVERFTITARMRKLIIQFDLTGEFPEGGFLFKRPTKYNTLEGRRKANRAWRRKALIDGQSRLGKGKKRGPKNDVHSIEGIRDGRGLVHFHREDA